MDSGAKNETLQVGAKRRAADLETEHRRELARIAHDSNGQPAAEAPRVDRPVMRRG